VRKPEAHRKTAEVWDFVTGVLEFVLCGPGA
jgi:hypothetical protein